MATGLDFLNCVSEDCMEYFIFSKSTTESTEDENVLKSLLTNIEKLIEKYTRNYLWHKDSFKLTVRTPATCILNEDTDEVLPGHLYGVTQFDDNIEDEWFIVSLLLKISEEISDVIIRVVDNDGEFLLIESANYLPDWADPETCNGKVFIYNGAIHILPPNATANSIQEAITLVHTPSYSTEASTDIQASIRKRIRHYPEQIESNLHSATVYLPVGIAVILKHKPNLISPAILSFCNRSTDDLKICRAMKYFPPENRVMTRVKFTKCLYAMLVNSKFIPDKRTGWNLPSVGNKSYKAHNLGVKIACGFEILISQAKPSQGIENDREWICYLKKLNEKGYFKELVENSREYNDLLNTAKDYYITHRDLECKTPILGQEILELSKNLAGECADFLQEEDIVDDDDSWLNINENDLDKMLKERYGPKEFVNINETKESASNITKNLNEFIDHESGIDGAEFPNESTPPKPKERKKKNRVSFDTKNESNPRVHFDSNAFASALQNILDFVIPEDNWESDSDMSAFEDEKEVELEDGKIFKNKMEEYMAQMDSELAQTNIGKSFEKKTKSDTFEDVEDFVPVDIDMNALKNVLESYQAQMGESGPISNMLGPMGVHLQPDAKRNGQQ